MGWCEEQGNGLKLAQLILISGKEIKYWNQRKKSNKHSGEEIRSTQMQLKKQKENLEMELRKWTGITWSAVKRTKICQNYTHWHFEVRNKVKRREKKLMKWNPMEKKNSNRSENNEMEWDDIKCREMDQTLLNWSSLKSPYFISGKEMKSWNQKTKSNKLSRKELW